MPNIRAYSGRLKPLQSLTWGIVTARWKEGCFSSSTHLDQSQDRLQIPATPTWATRNTSIPRKDWTELSAEQSLASASVLPGEILQATRDSQFCKSTILWDFNFNKFVEIQFLNCFEGSNSESLSISSRLLIVSSADHFQQSRASCLCWGSCY